MCLSTHTYSNTTDTSTMTNITPTETNKTTIGEPKDLSLVIALATYEIEDLLLVTAPVTREI